MEIFGFLLVFLLLIVPIIAYLDFILSLTYPERKRSGKKFLFLDIITMVIGPIVYLAAFDISNINDCCGDSAIFSPDHRLSIYFIIPFCWIAYFAGSYRQKLSSPIVEIFIHIFLLISIVLNIFASIQIENLIILVGNVPIILLCIGALIRSHHIFKTQIDHVQDDRDSLIVKMAWNFLNLSPIYKYPLLFILCLPIIAIMIGILMLFGQKPDSTIQAFTETYKHGFSELDHLCKNVECGEHFLCSVAAGGHQNLVKPERYGIRNGGLIICNRQLLISNAFEELLQDYLPKTHRFIRQQYNKVGNQVHRHYHIFNNKYVADLVYILMKPLEWCFLLVLYIFDRKPENRIAKQYTRKI